MDKAEGYEMQKSLFRPALLKKKFPDWTREYLCTVGLDILNKIEYLHANNIIIGDINPNNILVTEKKSILLIQIAIKLIVSIVLWHNPLYSTGNTSC